MISSPDQLIDVNSPLEGKPAIAQPKQMLQPENPCHSGSQLIQRQRSSLTNPVFRAFKYPSFRLLAVAERCSQELTSLAAITGAIEGPIPMTEQEQNLYST
jgi:hypothetical protein